MIKTTLQWAPIQSLIMTHWDDRLQERSYTFKNSITKIDQFL